ncbi:hypothetical protein GRAN_5118 [Granulicella sibirica]|uniref:Uncharacterized protein n=1 Tax=Granulicella sibirica TaxID=2479048 RepID=A0A4Q0SV16_9BACT|nr:hypothetical protein GRAN_5118 [Granulicella sibirica]
MNLVDRVLGLRTLIGVITGTRRDKYEDQIAWIRPLAEATNDSWEAVLAPQSEFPSRGSIFWPRASGAKENALVRFHAKENDVKNGGPDEYMAVDSQLAFEALDLRWVGDCEQVRLALTHGIELPHLVSPKYMIRCGGDLVVGPVGLVSENTGKVVLEKNNRARISCYQLGDDAFLGIAFDDETRTILARSLPPTPHSYVDWDDDKPVMRRAIEAAARLKANGTNLPRQVLEDATVQLTQYGAGASARLEFYRLNRAKQLAADTQQVISLAEEIFRGLRNHPSVLQEAQNFYEGQRGEIRARIESEHESEQAAVTKLREERHEAEEALASAKRQLEETEASHQKQVSGIEAALLSRIDQVLGNVPTLLADVALLRPFLKGRSSPQPRVTWAPEWPVTKVKIAEIKELRSRMIPALRALGVATTSYQPIHAAFASGFVPVVSGARALEALEAYAHVMCGGRQVLVEVTSAIADVQDLFGKLEHGTFVPHPAGLLDIIRAAREHEGPFLVVLDGINRGPTESYLLPLLRLVRNHKASIPLFHPGAIDSTDPYQSEARLQWPTNLLLAATVIEGPTTLPVAPDVWKDGILAIADADGEFTERTELGDSSEVDGSSGLLDVAPARDQLEWMSEGLPQLHGNAKRLAGALAAVISDQSAQQTAITKSIVVPYLSSLTNDDERAAEITRLEKTLNDELGEWVSLARRSIA